MKKILYIHHGKGVGGAAISLLQMVKSLDKTKFNASVLFMQDSDAVDLFLEEKIKIIGPINRSDFSHTVIWWYRWYHIQHFFWALIDCFRIIFFDAPKFFTQIRPDIIHLNTSSLSAWAIAAKRRNIPVIWHVREPLAIGYFGLRKKLITFLVKKFATRIIPICKNDAMPWKELSKTKVVYNAVDEKKFILPKKIAHDSGIKILFLGGSSKEKGALQALLILQSLLAKRPKAKLIIAGYWQLEVKSILKKMLNMFNIATPAEKYFQQINQLAKELQNNIAFIGPVKNIVPHMQQSSFLIFPCVKGHFARPVIEAGFLGKVALASQLQPLEELIVNLKTGFLLNPKSPIDWAVIIEMLTEKPQAMETISLQARLRCLELFSLKKQIKIIEKIYQN